MDHMATLAASGRNKKSILVRATGRFSTPPEIGNRLAQQLMRLAEFRSRSTFPLVDPFCGDGRLLVACLREAAALGVGRDIRWEIACWDLDGTAVTLAHEAVLSAAEQAGVEVSVELRCHDTLLAAASHHAAFDCVITNQRGRG